MKVLLVTFLFSLNAYALNGLELADCLEKAINQNIKDYKVVVDEMEVESKLPDNLHDDVVPQKIVVYKGDVQNICDELSSKDKALLSGSFSEKYQGEIHPFDEEDIDLVKIQELSEYLLSSVNCYSTGGIMGEKLKEITQKRNRTLILDAITLMVGTSSRDILQKPLGDFKSQINNYCKN